ncbi:MAG TPA: hypothetical protein VL334_14200 [Anaerolineae bacterium]|nr:hypothetical protein [Anaerolineae bacterium]
MKPLLLLLIAVGLLAACAAPATPAAPPASQPASRPSLPEVTVFRSPT